MMRKMYLLKEVFNMFTFLVLIMILLIFLIITAVIVALGGSVFILVFGDLIVCIAIIVWIIKKITKKKK